MTKEDLEYLLNELIFQSYQSALAQEGAAGRANEIKDIILMRYEDVLENKEK